jgi:hypothetical protein
MRQTVLIGLLAAMAAVSGWAQPDGPGGGPAGGPAGDPPSRVARLNLLLGSVSFRPGTVDDWAPATVNYPLTTGDHLWTEAGSKAEMHVGSTAIRMDGRTALSVLNLDDHITQLSVTGGTVDVHIRYLDPNEAFEVDTPNVAISLLRPGDYRIGADGDQGTSYAVVRGGEAEATGNGGAMPIRAGQMTNFVGTDQVTPQMFQAPPFDAFDQWAMDRDGREASAVSARYVPREMIGYEDLDQYGMWRNVPPYGWVWTPASMQPGWAPYRFGHWAWVEPWGWTWIDDAPWGFAPFHYGRWAFAGGAWLWVPGRMVVGVRPVYAPALVAFVGGPRFNVAIGVGGGVGVAAWFPLGPGEVYRPAYRVSPVYVQNINIVHVSNVTVINSVNVTNVRYMNQNVVGAVTVVPHDAFAAGRPVAVAAVAVRPGAMAQAEIVETARVAPTREAVLGHAGPMGAVHAPPARFVDRTVVARNTPPPPPVSFAARQQALRADPGRPMAPEAVNSMRPVGQQHPMVRTVGGGAPAGGPGQHFGSNAPRPNAETPEANRPMRNDRPPGAQQQPQRPYNSPAQQQNQVQQHPYNAPAQTPAARGPENQQKEPEAGRGERTNNERQTKGKQEKKKENKRTEKQ